MPATYEITKMAALRAKGYSTGFFPCAPSHVSPKMNVATFKLAMGRTVKINLISSSWTEESEEGKMKGKISPQGKVEIKRGLKKIA